MYPSVQTFLFNNLQKDGWYAMLQSGVDHFRDFLGIPDTERYNSVLFGGKYYRMLLTIIILASVFA